MPGTALLTMLIPVKGAEHSESDITSQSLEFCIHKKRKEKEKSVDLQQLIHFKRKLQTIQK